MERFSSYSLQVLPNSLYTPELSFVYTQLLVNTESLLARSAARESASASLCSSQLLWSQLFRSSLVCSYLVLFWARGVLLFLQIQPPCHLYRPNASSSWLSLLTTYLKDIAHLFCLGTSGTCSDRHHRLFWFCQNHLGYFLKLWAFDLRFAFGAGFESFFRTFRAVIPRIFLPFQLCSVASARMDWT